MLLQSSCPVQLGLQIWSCWSHFVLFNLQSSLTLQTAYHNNSDHCIVCLILGITWYTQPLAFITKLTLTIIIFATSWPANIVIEITIFPILEIVTVSYCFAPCFALVIRITYTLIIRITCFFTICIRVAPWTLLWI